MSSGASQRRKEEGKKREYEVRRYERWLGPVRGPIALAARPNTGTLSHRPSGTGEIDPWLICVDRALKHGIWLPPEATAILGSGGANIARLILNQADLPISLVEEFDAIGALSGAAGVYARIAEMTDPR